MGSFCNTPKAPTPPDPTVVANAQGAANIASAQAQQKMNMVGTAGPDGTVGWAVDANQPGGYTQTTTLSPGQQQLHDSGLQAQNSALGVANDQIGRVGQALSGGLNLDGLPKLSGGVDLSNLDPSGVMRGFNPGQQVQGQVGSADFNGAARDAANAMYGQATSRLDPQWQQAQSDEETQLANQGLGANSTAYQKAMDTFNRGKNDAYNQANYSSIGAGLAAQQQQFGQQLNQGQFANQAAAQMYGQNQGQAAFNNQAQNQQYGQAMSADQMAMQNAQFQNQARQQGLQERAYVQNEPLNQFNSLMSSSQVGTPTGVQYTPSQVNPTDVLGAYALNSQVAGNNYQAGLQNQAANMAGLFKLGSAAATAMSDVRLKRNTTLVGREEDGLGVWSYHYLWDHDTDPLHIGVMAQEAQKLRPSAVVEHPSGFLMVDYGKL